MQLRNGHEQRWRERYQRFDAYADLVHRGLCSLPEAVDSYLWEVGYQIQDRRRLVNALIFSTPRPTS